MSNTVIRAATVQDAGVILALLRELAAYEKLLDRFRADEDSVRRDMLGGACDCDLAFVGDAAAGIVTSLRTYKSFSARRGLFVEDLYVRPAFRGQGLGKRLLAHLAARAGDGFLEWQVLDWNSPAIAFYESLGAALSPEWITCRLDGTALKALAS